MGIASQRLFDSAIVGEAQHALDLKSILQASTEHSIVGTGLDGKILFWNAGARKLYGYEAYEVVGKANSSILHTPENVKAGLNQQCMDAALRDDKWQGTIKRARKDGTHFTARVVITPRRDAAGKPVGYLLISTDVSDELLLIKELEATQLYTRSLLESNIDALMTTDPLGIITDVNQQMENLTGYSRDELIRTPFKTYFTDPALAESGIKRALRDGRVNNFELTVRSKNGRSTTVSYNASTFRDAEGKLRGVFNAARDITEQKGLEHQLRESEAYNRGLIEASVDGLITVDPTGTISDVNETMCRLTGFSREELIGTPFADYFVDAESATAGVNQTFDKGEVKDYVLTLATRDNRRLRVSINASTFRASSGDVRGIFASARDITEQARLQTELADQQAYSRGLIESSKDGLVMVDPSLTISDVNETMCRMSGYSRDELIGSHFQNYFTDRRYAADGVRLTFDQGAVTNYELTLRTKDGQERLVSFNAAIFKDQTGKVRGIFASARDITAQAQLQSQIAEQQAYTRGLIESSKDGLVMVDASMTITDVNDTMCRMVGRQRTQLIGSSFPDYFVERELAAEGVRLTLQVGSVTNYVLTLTGADAREVPVSFNAATFKDPAGDVRGIFASARDITAQKQLEDQLRDADAYTRSLIDSNIDALMTTDALGIITDVNHQMETLTGCSRNELIKSPFKNYFTDPERANEGIKLVLRRRRVTNYELTACAKNGKLTEVSYNAVTFTDAAGALRGVFAAARDVTEQKKLEAQLREQQTYLRGLIDSSADGLVTVDPAGSITDVNDRMCAMTGYSRAELTGSPFADYFQEPVRATAGVKTTLDTGFVTEYALTLVSRFRRLLHVSFNASLFKDPSGAVRGIFASVRDVTDPLRLEEQLAEQQTYLRGLIDSIVDGLVTVDPDGFITDVNEQMIRMTGHVRGELVGSAFKQYFTEPERAEAGIRNTLAEGVTTNYELVLRAKGGRKATVSFNGSVYRDADHRIQGIFGSARDISEQARLQTQVSEQQAYSRSLIEASADALFAIAPDGMIIDVNEEATRLTGYPRKHLINSRFSNYFTDPERARAGVQETLAEGRVIGYELILTTRHGRRFGVSLNAGVFTDAAGTPQGVLAGARDITAQKQLEQQLRDSQFYTRSLIESNIDALMTTDQLGVITDVNHEMEALTGHSRDELIGTPVKGYFTDPERAEAGIKLVLEQGRVTNYELTGRSKDGKETVVGYNAATFYDQAGRLEGVFAAARDITERKRFEEALQKTNAELKNATLAKDLFLTGMSHELRTPLNAIIGFTGTLLMRLPGPLTAEQDKQLSTVESSATHLLSLINDLLDLAKIESGKVEVNFETVGGQSVVNETADALRSLAERKGLRLEIVEPQDEITMHTDRRALSQILLNLTSNAIKYTEKGFVRVELSRRQTNGRHSTVLEVTDSGLGIRAEDQPKLFEAFRQVDTSSTRRFDGAGLGLYLSRKLATLLGAELTFTSEYGVGSIFTLALPEN
jgi:PAS domain S-box-containing protein